MRLNLAVWAAPLVLAGCASGFPGFGGHHAASARAGGAGPSSAEMQAHREQMQALQQRMAAAQTEQERDAIRAEHGRLMQEGAAMEGRMGPGMMGGMGHRGRGPGMGMGSASGTTSQNPEALDPQTVEREVERSPGP